MRKQGITSYNQVTMFLAQTGHETVRPSSDLPRSRCTHFSDFRANTLNNPVHV
jgi:predicted chitinase